MILWPLIERPGTGGGALPSCKNRPGKNTACSVIHCYLMNYTNAGFMRFFHWIFFILARILLY
jgi:hypothetical protein